jgi:hypothetical protein
MNIGLGLPVSDPAVLLDWARRADASRRHRQDWLNGRLAELNAAERDDLRRVAPLLLRIADS